MSDKLWAIVVSNGHDGDCVYSIWSTKALAEAECKRLISTHTYGLGAYGDSPNVTEVHVDKPRDEWIS